MTRAPDTPGSPVGSAVLQRDDADLLHAIAHARDQEAFAELASRYQRDAYNLAVYILGRGDAAEETVQDALLRVWTAAGTYRGEAPVKAWLMRIVANQSVRLIRKKKRQLRMLNALPRASANDAPLPEPEMAELTEALRQEVNRLPALERQLVALRFGGGLTQTEISAALAMPQQTVSYRITETLKLLREQLARAGFAVAAPVLAEELLRHALHSGVDAPARLHAKILERVARRGSLRSRRLRSGPRNALSFTTLASTALAAVSIAAAVWYANSSAAPVGTTTPAMATSTPLNNTTPEPAALPLTGAPEDNVKTLADWHRTWTFEQPPPSDIGFAPDGFTWNREKKALCATKLGQAFLRYNLPEQTLYFTISARLQDPAKPILGTVIIVKGLHIIKAQQHWLRPPEHGVREVFEEVWIHGRYLVSRANNQPSMVTVLEDDAQGGVFAFGFSNAEVWKITACPLKPEEVPAFVTHPKLGAPMPDAKPTASK